MKVKHQFYRNLEAERVRSGLTIAECAKRLEIRLVTLILTVVFAVLSLKGIVTAEQFLTVFTVVVSFYFGTQYEKNKKEE